MAYIGTDDYLLEVSRGNVTGVSSYNKFGSNSDVDTATTPEDLWGSSGAYTGFDATAGEAIEVLGADSNQAGTLVSSGTSTGGSSTTLVDTGATFVTDGVAVDDLIINDTDQFHGVVSAVTSETTLTVIFFHDGGDHEATLEFETGKAYRVVTTAGTGAAVVKLTKMLESDYATYISEYVIMNGGTPVDTVGTDYIRCSRMQVILSGSNGTNGADLQARQTTTTANVFCYVVAGHGQTLIAGDTIPANKTLYVTFMSVRMARSTGAAGAAEVDMNVRRLGESWSVKVHEYISDSQGFATSTGYSLAIPEYSDFIWQVDSVSDNNTQLSAQINGYLVDNE